MTVSTSPTLSAAALWRLRVVTFALAALAAGSVVFWVLKLGSSNPTPVDAATLSTLDSARMDAQAVARALGASQTSDVAPRVLPSQRWVLTGVARAGTTQGVALIAGEGQHAKPYRLKAPLEEGLYLVGLEPRMAHLGPTPDGPVSMTLELPKLRER